MKQLLERLKNLRQEQYFIICLLGLLLPNIALSLSPYMSLVAALLNIVAPMGLWCLVLARGKRPGKVLLLGLWLMLIINSVQLVLLTIFDGAVISVDLLLSLFSASGDEAGELLGGLILPIALVLITHIILVCFATWSWRRQRELHLRRRVHIEIIGFALIGLGLPLAYWSHQVQPSHTIRGDIYPINVFYNMYIAGDKLSELAHLDESSRPHSYRATSEHTSDKREVYIFVLGETSRAYSYQLYGYPRETNPRLTARDSSLVVFRDILTQSNTTSKSAPILLSPADAENNERLNKVKGIMTAMREAGFYTAFISNQPANRSFLDHFAYEADKHIRIKDVIKAGRSVMDLMKPIYDTDMLPFLDEVLQEKHQKLFVIMHCYGAHWSYPDRYPEDFAFFKDDKALGASPLERERLVNAYDNAIRYTDFFLDEVIKRLEADTTATTAMYYTADHGEDVFDDERERILHSSPTISYYQLHVPGILWFSPRYAMLHGDKISAARANSAKAATSRSNFHTLLTLAGIKTYERQDTLSLLSPLYREGLRTYLNDRYECVPIAEMLEDEADLTMWHKMGLRPVTPP